MVIFNGDLLLTKASLPAVATKLKMIAPDSIFSVGRAAPMLPDKFNVIHEFPVRGPVAEVY